MKPGEHVRAAVRRHRLEVARRHWWRLAMLAGGGVATTWLLFRTLMWTGLDAHAWFFAGVSLTAVAALVGYFFMLDGSAQRRMGGTAEEWTAGAFSRLRRHGWTTLHNIVFADGDVDHVAIGPRQILAVETKFTTRDLAPDAATGLVRVPDAWLAQARRGARKIRLLLKSYGIEEEVTPVLVLWGPGLAGSRRAWAPVEGVSVLVGARAKEWSAGLRRLDWSRQPTHRARAAIEDYLARRDRGTSAKLVGAARR